MPATARTAVVAARLDRYGRVDEVPAPAVLHERGLLAVAVLALAVVPACRERDKGVFR